MPRSTGAAAVEPRRSTRRVTTDGDATFFRGRARGRHFWMDIPYLFLAVTGFILEMNLTLVFSVCVLYRYTIYSVLDPHSHHWHTPPRGWGVGRPGSGAGRGARSGPAAGRRGGAPAAGAHTTHTLCV